MNGFKTLLIGLLATISFIAQADTIMIRGATVHTMSGDGTLENTDVFISGGAIQKIGKNLPVPQDDVFVFDAETFIFDGDGHLAVLFPGHDLHGFVRLAVFDGVDD